VIAFDTGPGNIVIDALTREFTKGKQNYDRGGKIAASGKVVRPLLDELLRDPYYRRRPPKSAGREQYGAEFVVRMQDSGAPLQDLITTATVLTAATIAQSVCATVEGPLDLIVSGGGAHNPEIVGHLSAFLPLASVARSSDFGVDVDAKEAIAFAILAYETWRGRPANLPSATGARRAVLLGSVTPTRISSQL
jgi:anhydro-N-acetylmuramic acid kinase